MFPTFAIIEQTRGIFAYANKTIHFWHFLITNACIIYLFQSVRPFWEAVIYWTMQTYRDKIFACKYSPVKRRSCKYFEYNLTQWHEKRVLSF
jgi:hypothetical protein